MDELLFVPGVHHRDGVPGGFDLFDPKGGRRAQFPQPGYFP